MNTGNSTTVNENPKTKSRLIPAIQHRYFEVSIVKKYWDTKTVNNLQTKKITNMQSWNSLWLFDTRAFSK